MSSRSHRRTANYLKASIYENIPAARNLQVVFRADVLARHVVPRKVRKTILATLHDAEKGEIAKSSLRCCYLDAVRSLARAIKRKPAIAGVPPPYSEEDLVCECSESPV
jgi:hypothetical protein